MRTTVTLDTDVYRAANFLAQVTGKRLGKVLSELARRGMERREAPEPQIGRRFPSFEVPAGAPVIAAGIQEAQR
jgi:hypothetical protein